MDLLVSGAFAPHRGGMRASRKFRHLARLSPWLANELGVILLFVAFVMPMGWLVNLFYGRVDWALFFWTPIAMGVATFIFGLALEAQTSVKMRKAQYRACLWCRHPLTDGIEWGRCPECGRGYYAKVVVELMESAHGPDRRTKLTEHRSRQLWREALIQRDREASESE
ncbi:MAG: hypothetical protein AAF138_07525 [Planctomycetota bacterium]